MPNDCFNFILAILLKKKVKIGIMLSKTINIAIEDYQIINLDLFNKKIEHIKAEHYFTLM